MDFDIEHERREEVFEYIKKRFGAEHTAQIITYGTEKLRSAIQDLCRTLRETDAADKTTAYGPELAEQIKKTIPFKFPDQTEPTYQKMMELATHPENFREDFREKTDKLHDTAVEFKKYMDYYPKVHDGVRFIEGLIRNYGKHAAAVVITEQPITDHIPMYLLKKDDVFPVTAFNMKEVDDDLGMLKLDALSLKSLTVVRKAVDNINSTRTGQPVFDIRKISTEDEDTFRMIREGNTVGVFQISGNAITQYTKRLRPQKFDDIVDVLAIYRPGPLEGEVEKGVTMAEKYIDNYDQDVLDDFMSHIPERVRDTYRDTRGILIYQEQILELSQTMAGYSLGGADLLRRAIGKKDANLMKALSYEFVYGTKKAIPMLQAEINALKEVVEDEQNKPRIKSYEAHLTTMTMSATPIDGCVARGFDEAYSLQTFAAIERFSGYSFNRSHSAAYALIAYWMAYLKTHYPVEFMAAILTVEASDGDDTIHNVNECRRLDIDILPPDINRSTLGFGIELVPSYDEEGNQTGFEKAIRFGLESIKGIGRSIVDEILSRPARDKDPSTIGSDYQDFDDFFKRVNKRTINKSYLEKLIQAGCFDEDVPNRYQLLNHFYFALRKDKEFQGTHDQYLEGKKKKKGPDKVTAAISYAYSERTYNDDVISQYEQELFGFYLTKHPYKDLPYKNWDDISEGESVDMGGKIIRLKTIKTKKGDLMCFLDVETAGGTINVTVFPNTYNNVVNDLFQGNIAVFRGKKQTRDDDPTLLLDKIIQPRKKKHKVKRDAPVADMAKRKEKAEKETLDDMGGPVIREDPLADMFNEIKSS